MQDKNIEIERKFLIGMPSPELLAAVDEKYYIVQTYLCGCGVTRRLRHRTADGHSDYFYTEKKRIDDIQCFENERKITATEYKELAKQADVECRPIEKTRYIYCYKDQKFEIDVYPFWSGQAIMELELTEAGQSIEWPPHIRLLREVTKEAAYKNYALSKFIPEETI